MLYNPAHQQRVRTQQHSVHGKRKEALMTKREFLTAGIGTGLALAARNAAFAQQSAAATRKDGGRWNERAPKRMAKTTKLFKSPPGYPNAIAVTPEGLWIGEQKMSGTQAAAYHLPEPRSL